MRGEFIWFTDVQREYESLLARKPYSIASETAWLLLQSMKEHDIELRRVSLPKLTTMLVHNPRACIINRVRSQSRLRHEVFSQPLNLYPGLQLYYVPELFAFPAELRDTSGKLISLSGLFEKYPDKVMGVSQGRSYGPWFDSRIANLSQQHLFTRLAQDGVFSLKKMLLMGRIDFLLEFPVNMEQASLIEKERQALRFVSVSGAPEYVLGRVSCSKSKEGREMLALINQALSLLYPTQAFYQAHVRHLGADYLPLFNRHFKRVFGAEVSSTGNTL